MPIEIRELVIRAQVEPSGHQASSSRATSPSDHRSQEDLIRICVQEVLRILEEKRER